MIPRPGCLWPLGRAHTTQPQSFFGKAACSPFRMSLQLLVCHSSSLFLAVSLLRPKSLVNLISRRISPILAHVAWLARDHLLPRRRRRPRQQKISRTITINKQTFICTWTALLSVAKHAVLWWFISDFAPSSHFCNTMLIGWKLHLKLKNIKLKNRLICQAILQRYLLQLGLKSIPHCHFENVPRK